MTTYHSSTVSFRAEAEIVCEGRGGPAGSIAVQAHEVDRPYIPLPISKLRVSLGHCWAPGQDMNVREPNQESRFQSSSAHTRSV